MCAQSKSPKKRKMKKAKAANSIFGRRARQGPPYSVEAAGRCCICGPSYTFGAGMGALAFAAQDPCAAADALQAGKASGSCGGKDLQGIFQQAERRPAGPAFCFALPETACQGVLRRFPFLGRPPHTKHKMQWCIFDRPLKAWKRVCATGTVLRLRKQLHEGAAAAFASA